MEANSSPSTDAATPLPVILAVVYGAVAALQLWISSGGLAASIGAAVAAVCAVLLGVLSVVPTSAGTTALSRVTMAAGGIASIVVGVGAI